MARIVTGGRPGCTDPLKHSQPLGGALAFLGLAGAMPVLHGSKGCASFAKALLTRHFREPVPLQTTAVTEVDAVLGAGGLMVATLEAIRAKHRPQVLGLLTTGLTEVNGEDVAGELRDYLAGPDPSPPGAQVPGPLVVPVSTPDFRGGLSDGYAAALQALVRALPVAAAPQPEDAVAVLVGPALTAADVEEVADLVAGFGLAPTVVPDLSGSLDGHLAAEWSPLTTGGTPVEALRALTGTRRVTAIGATTGPAAAALAARSGAGVTALPHLGGLAAADALVADLLLHSGRPVPERVRRSRARLADGLLDTHFILGGARVAVAGEPELLQAVAAVLHEAGAQIVAAVSPTPAPGLADLPCAEVVVGDLVDLQERAAEGGAELLLASSHARAAASRAGAAHLAVGFPVFDRVGAQLRGTAGYRGSLQLLLDAANTLLDHRARHEHPQHRPADGGSPLAEPAVATEKESMC